jgi:hypothetical protein
MLFSLMNVQSQANIPKALSNTWPDLFFAKSKDELVSRAKAQPRNQRLEDRSSLSSLLFRTGVSRREAALLDDLPHQPKDETAYRNPK